jgi:hypothetical protein
VHHRVDNTLLAQPMDSAVGVRQIEPAVLGQRVDKGPRTDPESMPDSSFRP